MIIITAAALGNQEIKMSEPSQGTVASLHFQIDLLRLRVLQADSQLRFQADFQRGDGISKYLDCSEAGQSRISVIPAAGSSLSPRII
eukprot:g3910.t1